MGRDGGKKGASLRETLERRIDQAMGRMAADLVVRNARILDLATGAIHSGDIAICGEMIVGTGDSYRGVHEIDADGRIAVPGFIDSHVHCESTLVVPGEFDRYSGEDLDRASAGRLAVSWRRAACRSDARPLRGSGTRPSTPVIGIMPDG